MRAWLGWGGKTESWREERGRGRERERTEKGIPEHTNSDIQELEAWLEVE